MLTIKNNKSESTPNNKISEFSWFTPRPPKGGVPNNERHKKVPFRGFRGEFTFWSQLKSQILLITCVLTGIISCTERIDLELDKTFTRLVVYGEVTTDTTIHRVRLTKTSDYFSNSPPLAVSGAEVSISSGQEVFILFENPDHPGLYESSPDFYGVPGKTYHLRIENVDIDNDGNSKVYEASSFMPLLNPLDSIALKYTQTSFFSGWEVQVYSLDPADSRDFYAFKVYKNRILQTDTLTEYFVQSDDFFNGNYTNGITSQFLNDDKPDEKALPGDTITFEINAINNEFFIFVQEAQSEVFPSTPLFGGPSANISTNISNGAIGIFHAYSLDRKTTVVPEYPD